MSSIHPTAIVDADAKIGNEVEIGPYCIIGPHVELGDGCRLHSHVVVQGRTALGNACELFPFASIGNAPQDLKFGGEPSTLVVGAKNVIREYVTLQPGTAAGNMTTVIGENNLFMACSHVGHDSIVGDNNVFANSVALAGHVTVEDNAIIGGLVGVHQYARIGSYAFLSGGAMATLDIPPFCFGQGDRCMLRGINVVGMQRAGHEKSDILEVRRTYRHLFSSRGNLNDKISSLPPELSERPLVKQMLDFIKSSKRGVAQAAKTSEADS